MVSREFQVSSWVSEGTGGRWDTSALSGEDSWKHSRAALSHGARQHLKDAACPVPAALGLIYYQSLCQL